MMELQRKLLPSHTYSHVSGGAPLNILDLTWEALKEFHSKHYHPSNSRYNTIICTGLNDSLSLSHTHSFITYGDMPVLDHLQYINDNILKGFSLSTPSLEIPLESRWTEPVCLL